MRERHVWIAVTAGLATSLAWLSTLMLVLAARSCATHCPEIIAVLRAVGRAALAVSQAGWPALLAATLGAALLLILLWRGGASANGRTGHA
jgi:hypothetical protein